MEEDLKKLIKGSFGIALNANDFFAYACADMVLLDERDLVWVLPIFQKHNWTGIYACMAYIAKQMPIKPYRTEEFESVYKELKLLNPEVFSEC